MVMTAAVVVVVVLGGAGAMWTYFGPTFLSIIHFTLTLVPTAIAVACEPPDWPERSSDASACAATLKTAAAASDDWRGGRVVMSAPASHRQGMYQ